MVQLTVALPVLLVVEGTILVALNNCCIFQMVYPNYYCNLGEELVTSIS